MRGSIVSILDRLHALRDAWQHAEPFDALVLTWAALALAGLLAAGAVSWYRAYLHASETPDWLGEGNVR